jgi:hypothetical protein
VSRGAGLDVSLQAIASDANAETMTQVRIMRSSLSHRVARNRTAKALLQCLRHI